MATVCGNGEHRASDGTPFEIPDGERRIEIPALTVRWGDRDLRGDWTGAYTFCSFACLQQRAADWAATHDAHVLREGEPPDPATG